MRVHDAIIKTSDNYPASLGKALNEEFETYESENRGRKVVGFTIIKSYLPDRTYTMDFSPPMCYEVLIHTESI